MKIKVDEAQNSHIQSSGLSNTESVKAAPSRQDLINRLEWNNGGMGHGICSFASSMLWAMNRPKHPRGEDDLQSIVAVSGPPDKYTDEELAALVAFSDEQTADYDKMFNWRLGANLICINKFDETSWMRKRLSWEYGPMFSTSLEDALSTFRETQPTASVSAQQP